MAITLRSYLSAGLTAGLLATTAAMPVSAPAAAPLSALPMVSVPAVDLAAALQPLLDPVTGPTTPASATANVGGETASPGDVIINVYNAVQPWVAYGVELFAWAVAWLPWPIGLLAPQADIIYSGWQPFAESVAYSLAFLVDGQFDLVLPTLANGIQTGVSTLIQNEIDWILGFFPPLPPFPPFGGAAVLRTPTPAAVPAGPEAAAVETVTSDPVAAAPVEDPSQPVRPAASGRASAERAAVRASVRALRTVPAAAATAGQSAAGDNSSAADAEVTDAGQTAAESAPATAPRSRADSARAVRGGHDRTAAASRQGR